MKRLPLFLFAFVVILSYSAVSAVAAESATGTWKWTFATQNGDSFDTTLKLKQDGEKLTGTMNNRFGDSTISDGSIKDGKVSFQTKRELNGAEFVVKYSGKLEGDKITGKTEFTRDGQTRDREWIAKREGAKASASTVAGTWNTALIINDGNRIEGTLKLKQEGDKLTGSLGRNDADTAIQDGKITGDEIYFVIKRDRDGRTVTAKYKGKVSGDTVKGKVESDWSGDWQTLDWEGTKAK
jgi:hypothetical protein